MREVRIYRRSGIGLITIVLLLANIVVFVKEFKTGNMLNNYLIAQGGLSYDLVVNQSESYRLITSMFLHANFYHILCNMYSLCSIGSIMDTVMSYTEYVLTYFVSGVCGGLMVLYADSTSGHITQMTVGASGAIFGLFGAYLALSLTRRVRINSIVRLFICIVLMLAVGLTQPGVSVSAHLGGLIGGFVFCLFFSLFKNSVRKSKMRRRY